jgi:hypothetical protein
LSKNIFRENKQLGNFQCILPKNIKKNWIFSPFFDLSYTKGLVAVCHSFCLFFVFITYSTDIHSITFIQSIYPSPFAGDFLHLLIAFFKLSGKNPPCGTEPRIELGPALQQADALPTKPRRTLHILYNNRPLYLFVQRLVPIRSEGEVHIT